MPTFDSGNLVTQGSSNASSRWTTSLVPWVLIRLAGLFMPAVTGAIFNLFGDTNFGAGFGVFIGIWIFLLIGYGEARRQARFAAAYTRVVLSHAAAAALILVCPFVWMPGSGHPALP